jgi:hypothetical protein
MNQAFSLRFLLGQPDTRRALPWAGFFRAFRPVVLGWEPLKEQAI